MSVIHSAIPLFAASADAPAYGITSLGLVLLRVVGGLTLAAHGFNKLFGKGGIGGTISWFDSMGMKPNGKVHAYMAAFTELGGGVAFAAGFLTPLTGAAMVGLMVVAAWTTHRANGFFSFNSGWEYNLILASIGVGVATAGPGRFSIDHLVGLDANYSAALGLASSAGLGLVGGVGLLAACYRPPAKNS